jgi:heme/copper-type cytochrome/quinol oxidase subunit 2
MSNFDKIIEQIENQHIEPTPKWYFNIKNLWFWMAFITSLLIGSISFSIILYSIQQTDFELLKHLKHSRLETVLVLLPYFWLVFLLVFSIVAFVSFKHFKNAYKYDLIHILGLSVFLSFLLGTLIFISNGSKFLENKFANKVEIYKSIEDKRLQYWMNPEEGFLAGTIKEAKLDTIILIDFNQKKWNIYYHNVFIPPIIEITEGEQIKLVGKKINDSSFEATEIKPWGGFGKRKNVNKK